MIILLLIIHAEFERMKGKMQFELQNYLFPISSASEKKKAISCIPFSSESEP